MSPAGGDSSSKSVSFGLLSPAGGAAPLLAFLWPPVGVDILLLPISVLLLTPPPAPPPAGDMLTSGYFLRY